MCGENGVGLGCVSAERGLIRSSFPIFEPCAVLYRDRLYGTSRLGEPKVP